MDNNPLILVDYLVVLDVMYMIKDLYQSGHGYNVHLLQLYIYLPMGVALKCTYIHIFVLKLSRVITRLRYLVDYPWSYSKSELMVYVGLSDWSVCSVN